jgi:hypothetical protein
MKRRNRIQLEPMVGDHENPVMDTQPTPKKPRLRRTKMLNVRVSEPMFKHLGFAHRLDPVLCRATLRSRAAPGHTSGQVLRRVRVGVTASKPHGACAGRCRGCGRRRTRSRDLSKARARLRLPCGQTPTDPPSAMGGAAQMDLRGLPQAVPRLRRPDEDDRHHHACRRGRGAKGDRREAERSGARSWTLKVYRPRRPSSGRAEAHPAESCSRSGGRDDDRRYESRGFGRPTRESRGVGAPAF